MDKNQKLAKEIYQAVGGQENVNKIIHCMTRVRMDIKDRARVNMEDLKKIDGVMGVVDDEMLQVVVGPGTVNKVANAMVEMAGVQLGETFPSNHQENKQLVNEKAKEMKQQVKKKNQHGYSKVLKSIANIFVPLLPAFVGSGIIGGVASVLKNLIASGHLAGDVWTNVAMVCGFIQSGVFGYLVIYVGIYSAKEFGASPSLGGVIGGVTTLAGMNPDAPLKNIFTGNPLSAGQGGIIGVILAVYILSVIEKYLHRKVPESLDIIITPTVTLLITSLITIFLLMPFAGLISSSLVSSINWVLSVGGAFAGFILGTFFLPMVMLGLHQILTPIHLEMIQNDGMTLLLPILAMAGAGQVGTAIALWVKCRKNNQLVKMIKGALPVGILGIGEPLIYGVTLPLGRPFITACLGGGVGGAVIGLFQHVGAISIGPSGVALIPLINNGYQLKYVLGLLAAYAGGFVLTYFFGTTKEMQEGI